MRAKAKEEEEEEMKKTETEFGAEEGRREGRRTHTRRNTPGNISFWPFMATSGPQLGLESRVCPHVNGSVTPQWTGH